MTTTNTTTKTQRATNIKNLLNELNASVDQRAKKMIRAKLRRNGHYGASRVDQIFCTKMNATKLTLRQSDATTRQRDDE